MAENVGAVYSIYVFSITSTAIQEKIKIESKEKIMSSAPFGKDVRLVVS